MCITQKQGLQLPPDNQRFQELTCGLISKQTVTRITILEAADDQQRRL